LEVEAQPPVLAAEAHSAQLAAVGIDPIAVHAQLSRDRGGVREARLVRPRLTEQSNDPGGDQLYVLVVERHARALDLARLAVPQAGRRDAQCAIRARAIGT
jgi:hypothetical protein